MRKARNSYEIPVRKPEEKGPLRIARCTWENDINIDHKRKKEDDVNWINLYGTKSSHGGEYWNYIFLLCIMIHRHQHSSSLLKIEAVYFFETLLYFFLPTRRHVPEDL
jgi:hypothetical protein